MRLSVRKLKFFGIFCLLSYCVFFIAFAASTTTTVIPPVATSSTVEAPVFGSLPAPIGLSANELVEDTPLFESVEKRVLPLHAQQAEAPFFLSLESKALATYLNATSQNTIDTVPHDSSGNSSDTPSGNSSGNSSKSHPSIALLGIPLPSAQTPPEAQEPLSTPQPEEKSNVRTVSPSSFSLPCPSALSHEDVLKKKREHRSVSSVSPTTLARIPSAGFTLPLPTTTEYANEIVPYIQRDAMTHGLNEAMTIAGVSPTESPSHIAFQDTLQTTQPLSSSSLKNVPMNTNYTALTEHNAKKILLSNGLTVILQQDDRFPLVSLRLYVHAGSAYEQPQEAGISHVLEHMVFKGTENFKDGEIANEIERNGGYLNAFTSFDLTGYVVDLPSAQWTKGLSVLKDMAFLPKFTEEHLNSEKDVIVAELKRGKDNPGNVLFTRIIQDMFATSSYAHPIIGFEKTIRSFTLQNLLDYHERWYQPQAMTLVVCGNINLAQAEKQITQEFSQFTNTNTLTAPPRHIPPQTAPLVASEEGPWQKVRLALTFPAPGLRETQATHLDLLCHILGGDQTSPLYKKYKYDKRLVDSISMQNYSFEEGGLLLVMATLDAENVMQFWQELTTDLQKGFAISDEQLKRAQLALTDSFYRSRETLEGYASQIGHFNFYYNGEIDAQNYLATIANTNTDILQATYRKTLLPQQAGIFTILPPKAEWKHLTQDGSIESWLLAELNQNWPTATKTQAEKTLHTPTTQESITLANGCTVILTPDKTLPYVSVTMLYEGGESLLNEGNQGLGALTASVLTRGTKEKEYDSIQTFLAERAASLSASSNRQTFGLSFSAPSQFTKDLFELTREVITSPSFLPEETERAKENILAAIIRAEEQPLSLAFRHLTTFLYPAHSYGFKHLGTAESITLFTAQEAQELWTKQRSYPWVLSICGDFSRDEIISLAQSLPSPTNKAQTLATPRLNKQKELTLSLDKREQAHFFLIFPTPGSNSPDDAGLELLTNVLAGQSGLLFTELRDRKGLGYSVTAFPWKTSKAGALIFYIGTEPEKVDTAYTEFKKVIADLQATPLDEALLGRGKNILSGEYYRERQSLRARSAEAASLMSLGLPLDFKEQLVQKSQKLTTQDIMTLAQRYLVLEKAYILKVLPKT